jgi:hypothetical protein
MNVQFVAFPQKGMPHYPPGAEPTEESFRIAGVQVGGQGRGIRGGRGIGKGLAARIVGRKRRSGLSRQGGSP